MTHETRYFSDGGLFVQNHFEFFFFLAERIRFCWQNLIDYSHFLLYNKKKLLEMHILVKITLTSNKHPLKVTSTTFLFREVEILVVYSCYLISLYEKTSDKRVLVMNQSAYDDICKVSTQFPGP